MKWCCVFVIIILSGAYYYLFDVSSETKLCDINIFYSGLSIFWHGKLTTIVFLYSIFESNAKNRDLCCRRQEKWNNSNNNKNEKKRKETMKLIKVVIRRGVLHWGERELDLHDSKRFSRSLFLNSWIVEWADAKYQIHAHDHWFHAQLRLSTIIPI